MNEALVVDQQRWRDVCSEAASSRHPSGVECIEIVEHMGFCLGSAVECLWRADLKEDAIEDLEKAVWYIRREIERRKEAR